MNVDSPCFSYKGFNLSCRDLSPLVHSNVVLLVNLLVELNFESSTALHKVKLINSIGFIKDVVN
jgi:hypothetical protein